MTAAVKGRPFLLVGLALALLLIGGGWYVQGFNRSHPAPWPMMFGSATGAAATPGQFPQEPNILWRHPVPAASAYPPAIGADGVIYVPAGEQLLAVGPDGARRWAWKGSELVRAVALGRHGEVYALHGETLTALSAEGHLSWTFTLPSLGLPPPLVGPGGLLYLMAEHHILAVSGDGKLAWSREWNPAAFSWPVLTSDGLLLVAEGSELLALKPDGSQAWSMALSNFRFNGPLLVVDGANQVYVRSRDRMTILDDKGRIKAEAAAGLTPVVNLAVGKGFVQEGLVRWRPDGTREEPSNPVPLVSGVFGYLDRNGNLLLADRKVSGFEYVLRSPSGEEVWRLGEVRGQSLPALDQDGRICFVGIPQDEPGPALICLGESHDLP